MQRDDKNKYLIGSGQLKAVQVRNVTLGDNACINLGVDRSSYPGADPLKQINKQTYAIDNDGGTSELRLILTRYMVDGAGDALASGVVVTIDGTDYTTTTGGKIIHNVDGNTYTTLKSFVDAINELPGFVAVITDALTTHDTGTASFIDVAEAIIPSVKAGGVDTLDNDVSATFTVYKRIGIPRVQDKNPLQLLEVRGSSTDITNGTVELIRDDADEYIVGGSHQEMYLDKTLVAAETAYLSDNILEGQTIRGSVVLKVESDDLTAADFSVKFRQAIGL